MATTSPETCFGHINQHFLRKSQRDGGKVHTAARLCLKNMDLFIKCCWNRVHATNNLELGAIGEVSLDMEMVFFIKSRRPGPAVWTQGGRKVDAATWLSLKLNWSSDHPCFSKEVKAV